MTPRWRILPSLVLTQSGARARVCSDRSRLKNILGRGSMIGTCIRLLGPSPSSTATCQICEPSANVIDHIRTRIESHSSVIHRPLRSAFECTLASEDLDYYWERFCHDTQYVYTVKKCNDGLSTFKERLDLRRDLEVVHHIDSSSIEAVLDQGRRFALYAAKSKDE